MYVILRSVLWQSVFLYLENVLVFLENVSDHIAHLQQVSTPLQDEGVKPKSKKCLLVLETFRQLGHVVYIKLLDPSEAERQLCFR